MSLGIPGMSIWVVILILRSGCAETTALAIKTPAHNKTRSLFIFLIYFEYRLTGSLFVIGPSKRAQFQTHLIQNKTANSVRFRALSKRHTSAHSWTVLHKRVGELKEVVYLVGALEVYSDLDSTQGLLTM